MPAAISFRCFSAGAVTNASFFIFEDVQLFFFLRNHKNGFLGYMNHAMNVSSLDEFEYCRHSSLVHRLNYYIRFIVKKNPYGDGLTDLY